ncbi:MAG: pantoate--beta-alanine ligase [Acidimicrobiales bacterium]
MRAPHLIGPRRTAPSRVVVLARPADLRHHLDQARAAGLRVGVVPTMGSLHEGHLSLLRRAAADCDVVVVTIFVNPLQFGPGEDLATYPRDLDTDVELAAGAGAAVVFAPSVDEMYPAPAPCPNGVAAPCPNGVAAPCPNGVSATTVEVGALGEVYEGASRPGHFAGVATVVAKLLNAAGPCRAHFGEKDWQQLVVVRAMVDNLFLPVAVVGCPTVREPDGLACSSRNVRLAPDERRAARVLFEALSGAATLVRAGEDDPDAVRRHLVDTIAREPLVSLDYAAVVRACDLAPLDRVTGDVRLLVAARVGATRLIDNLGVT